ncbi:MAG: ArsR/SmtB family transcription factor [Candidatus Thorarchaeota archaeon]
MSNPNSFDESINLFWLLGNHTRFEILRCLANEPMFLGQLSRELAAHQQAILRHLQELIERGFLETYEDESIRGPPRKYYRLTKTVRLSVHITPTGIRVVRLVPGAKQPTTIEGLLKRNYPEISQLLAQSQRLPAIPNELDRKRAAIDLIQQLEIKAKETSDISRFLASVVSALQKQHL